MKKAKYYFNPHNLQYEKLEIPFRYKLLRAFGLVCAILVTTWLLTLGVNKLFPPQVASNIAQENRLLKDNYQNQQAQLKALQLQIGAMENRDNKIYRTIFEAKPIPDSIRQQTTEAQKAELAIATLSQNELIAATQTSIINLQTRLSALQTSYTELERLAANKADLLAHIPAIQPVSNKDLSRIASGFGMRIDPVYKTVKMHKGLDFTAPQGTPVYATANGIVTKAEYSPTGYGNHVLISHSTNYETLYGHMVKLNCTVGKVVTRGQLIGWVGSTGKSTGPHCHYEVHLNGEAVNPIYYFYNDLNAAQFEQLTKLAAANNQSID